MLTIGTASKVPDIGVSALAFSNRRTISAPDHLVAMHGGRKTNITGPGLRP